jgi:hypothetical protein
MLYMTILTWAPEKRDAVIDRVKKIGFEHPGVRTLGTWVETGGLRCFQLVDIPRDMDPALGLKNNFTWNDIMRIQSLSVIEANDMLKAIESMK